MFLTLALSLASFGAAQAQSTPPGTTSTVNSGPGDQLDPHVSGDLVSYTSNEASTNRIRYHNLATGDDAVVPNSGQDDFLSDISGNNIVFTRVSATRAIFKYTIGDASASELAPSADANRLLVAIGANTVAWQDLGFSTNALEAEIVVHDLATSTTTRLTTDALLDRTPGVSPDGTTVVWAKCQTNGTGCDIWKATGAGSLWTSSAVTGPEGEEASPDSNGTVIVYASTRAGEADIFYKPVAGGTEVRLALAGPQRRPSISGNLIVFEHLDATANWDIYAFDISTGTLWSIATTSSEETLSDVSVSATGLARVVYTRNETNQNVYAFSFVPLVAAVVPFAAFTAEVEIRFGPLLLDDNLEVKGAFTLGAGSDGIDLPNEAVSLEVGTYSRTIPSGSFSESKPGVFKSEELGLEVAFRVEESGDGSYTFTWEDSRAELTGTVNPVDVTLIVGDDGGTTTDEAEIK
jgi:hypothetical protein